MTTLNGIKLRGNETFTELLEIGKKINKCPQPSYGCDSTGWPKGRTKKNNSKKEKTSLICKAKKCDTVLKPDYLSRIDNAYCKDCLD